MLEHGLYFPETKDLGEIPTGSPTTGVPNRGGVGSDQRFSTNLAISQKLCKIGT